MQKDTAAERAARFASYSDAYLDQLYPVSHLSVKMEISEERIRRQKARALHQNQMIAAEDIGLTPAEARWLIA